MLNFIQWSPRADATLFLKQYIDKKECVLLSECCCLEVSFRASLQLTPGKNHYEH